MDYEVKIIADSISPAGHRLTTLTATYPRFIHSEILTHRDRARNSASSRAIPFTKLQNMIISDPVIPLTWGMEQKGMQTGGEIPAPLRALANGIWLRARISASQEAEYLHYIERSARNIVKLFGEAAERGEDETLSFLSLYQITRSEFNEMVAYVRETEDQDIRIHKSLPNRIVEPWMWITVVMSATEWKNFFRLRCHKDAEQHFQKIAGMMRESIKNSTPWEANAGDWHLPFICDEDHDYVYEQCQNVVGAFGYLAYDEILRRASVARCARVSYLTHDGKRDIDKDLELFKKLNTGSGAELPHASPYEHVAQCGQGHERSGPFIGWLQFRKQFPHENVEG